MLISTVFPEAPLSSICSRSLSPTVCQIHRHLAPPLLAANRKSCHRRRRQKLPEPDMPVAFPMTQPTAHRRDRDDGSFIVSANGSREGDLLTNGAENEAHFSSKGSPLRKNNSKSSFRCFGVDMSPDTIAVAMVYFVQGVLGLSRLAVSFYLKDDLHLDPAETAVITGFSSFPWLVKPIYGFISDSIPLLGYRRRSYLVMSGLLGALSWSLMATVVDNKYSAALCILLGSFSVAFSDVTMLLKLGDSCEEIFEAG